MVELIAVDGIGEITAGDDLAGLLTSATELAEGDVVVVTSKVVAKAAGLATRRPREEVLADETDRVVARRGSTSIVRTRHGLTMAAAGVDVSNVAEGDVIPLPPDPDGDARRLRARIAAIAGVRVGVIVADTAGRPWRVGQTDIAIGCAGLRPVEPFAGRVDGHGNALVVTAPAIADELAGAAELVSGKLGGRPFVVVRGVEPAWLTEEDGPGAAALIRPEGEDLFGWGTREAVLAAALRTGRRGFPGPPGEWEVLDDLIAASGVEATRRGDTVVLAAGADAFEAGALAERLRSVAFAQGLELSLLLQPSDDTGRAPARPEREWER